MAPTHLVNAEVASSHLVEITADEASHQAKQARIATLPHERPLSLEVRMNQGPPKRTPCSMLAVVKDAFPVWPAKRLAAKTLPPWRASVN